MKHEWRKHEKSIYIPKTKPELIDIPKFKYFTIKGAGNPNDDSFSEYIGVLYALSYAVKMSPKKGIEPQGYFDYTVYPLEGLWDIDDKAKQNFTGKLNKDDLVFNLMIRQPEFVTTDYAHDIIELTKSKKPHILLNEVKFEEIQDGRSVQMLHLGSYDTEPVSFKIMEDYAAGIGLERRSKIHREIYLSDPRKVVTEKLKTVLRFAV